MPSVLINVGDRLFGRPLLCTPERIEQILSVLGERVGLEVFEAPKAEARAFEAPLAKHGLYRVTDSGVAIVPIVGTLVNRGSWIGASSGLVSYEGITAQIKKAASDPEVRGIMLDIDSPGGEASGCFDLTTLIREVDKVKPVVAFANDKAASGGYALASGAREIWTTQTGMVGSIGVVFVHMDRAGQMAKAGVKPTIIHAGARKVDGHPFGPLPDDVRTNLQGEMERVRALFVSTVAGGRPKLSPEDIAATEARVYHGTSAVDAGLAECIGTYDSVLARLVSILPAKPRATPAQQPMEKAAMAENQSPAAAGPDQIAAAEAAGRAAGIAAERSRIAAIVRSDEAAGHADMALSLALDTSLPADEARKVLSNAPKMQAAATQSAPTPTTQLYAAIAKSGGAPNVPGVDAGAGATARKTGVLAERAKARFAKA